MRTALAGEQSFATLAVMLLHQRSLFGGGDPAVAAAPRFERIQLDDQSWIDVARGWLEGSDVVFDELVETVDWKQGKRWMYERMVDDPRLSRWFDGQSAVPHPVLADARRALEQHYGVRFGSVGLNYYRDGKDSVAWHSDKELRELDDTLVAILTLGSCRAFLIRPDGGGHSINLAPAGGDLLVMGGRCQMDWEHNVPKAKRAGPRISCSWRWRRAGAPSAPETADGT